METTMEQVYKNWMGTVAHFATIMFNAGKELAGEAYIQKVEEALYQEGLRGGTKMGLEEADCIAIGKVFDTLDESYANYWDGYVENSPTAFEKHITTCPVASFFSEAPEICTRLIASGMQGMVTGMNPCAISRFDEVIPKGDKTCHYRIEIQTR